MIRVVSTICLAISIANCASACSSGSEETTAATTDSPGDGVASVRRRPTGARSGPKSTGAGDGGSGAKAGDAAAGDAAAGDAAASGGGGDAAGTSGIDGGAGASTGADSTLSSVDTWVTGGVAGAKCYRLDANEGLFAGYPITKKVPLAFGATVYVGTLLGSSLLNWAAFTTTDCTGASSQSGLEFVPYKPGQLSDWTVTLK